MKEMNSLVVVFCCNLLIAAVGCAGSGDSDESGDSIVARALTDVRTVVEVKSEGVVGADIGSDSRTSNPADTVVDICSEESCLEECFADCVDVTCGNDGCGGSCGACSDGESCLDGSCLPEA